MATAGGFGIFGRFLPFVAILIVQFGSIVCPDWGGIWCYRCVSTQPGCGEFNFDWRWHWQWTCPRDDDKCVKIIEKKGAETLVTRECLSNLEGIRRDIPADRYEGCRPAATDVKLANYVFNDIRELDVKKEFFDETTFCFCSFDERCNSGSTVTAAALLVSVMAFVAGWALLS